MPPACWQAAFSQYQRASGTFYNVNWRFSTTRFSDRLLAIMITKTPGVSHEAKKSFTFYLPHIEWIYRPIDLLTYWPIDLLTNDNWAQNCTVFALFLHRNDEKSTFRACFYSFRYSFIFAKTAWTLYIQTFNSFYQAVKIFVLLVQEWCRNGAFLTQKRCKSSIHAARNIGAKDGEPINTIGRGVAGYRLGRDSNVTKSSY